MSGRSNLGAPLQRSNHKIDWDKAKERVIATMEAWKSNRLRSERVQLLMTRIKTMMLFVLSFRREYGKEAFPRARDFAALPEIQEIIDVPAEEEVTPESFMKLAPAIPRIVADWQQERFQYFETLLRERLNSTHCIVDSQLAVDQFFECGCGRLFDYQNMIAHDCNVDLSNSVSASIYEEAADRATQSRADVKITPFIVPVMGILEACRKDYHKCTAKEMDDSDIRLHCETCEVFHQGSGSRIFQVMNWRVAVSTSLFPFYTLQLTPSITGQTCRA